MIFATKSLSVQLQKGWVGFAGDFSVSNAPVRWFVSHSLQTARHRCAQASDVANVREKEKESGGRLSGHYSFAVHLPGRLSVNGRA